jgi:hypothetical protein
VVVVVVVVVVLLVCLCDCVIALVKEARRRGAFLFLTPVTK